MRVLLDTSALYKRYHIEAGREQLLEINSRATELVIARHCKAEIASALNRQRHDGMASEQDYARIMAEVLMDFEEFTVFELDARVEAFAIAAMEVSRLRAMDALHIGTAKAAYVDLFVTADKRQAAAAKAVGLKTELIEI